MTDHRFDEMVPRAERIRRALDAAQKAERIDGWQLTAPGDRGLRWNVYDNGGCERVYSTREVEAFLASGKSLWVFEYPESETRFRIGYADPGTSEGGRRDALSPGGYFVQLANAPEHVGRVSPFYRTRERAVRAALVKEAEYAGSES